MKPRLLLTVLALTVASDTYASLIYSGVQNVAIPLNFEGVYVRLSDSTVSASYPVNWDTEPWLNPFFGGVDVGNSPLLRPIITGSDQIVNLSLGTVIGSGSNFVAGESGSSTHTGAAANQFHIGTPGIIGFTFKTAVAGPDYYGWLRMTVDNTGAGSITDWAYNNTAGTPVLAGISAVPEPATVLVGMALCAVGMLRRRRAG
jgi:hypothetical protein